MDQEAGETHIQQTTSPEVVQRVEAVTAALASLDRLPPGEHVAAYERAHAELQAALSHAIDETLGLGERARRG